MAEEEKKAEPNRVEEAKAPTDEKPAAGEKKSFVAKFLPWIIMAVVAIVSAGAGIGLAKLFAGTKKIEPASQTGQKTPAPTALELAATGNQKSWYYDLEPVIANLNEPSATRYVRVTITFEMSEKIAPDKGKAFIDERKPELTNWLNIYLASQAVEDIRGDKNLRRIQSQILNAFNEKLFPSGQGGIKQVLFKEFAVQ
jgi:flagellar basal body-associated protein FliL